jgi:hypothetical protein
MIHRTVQCHCHADNISISDRNNFYGDKDEPKKCYHKTCQIDIEVVGGGRLNGCQIIHATTALEADRVILFTSLPFFTPGKDLLLLVRRAGSGRPRKNSPLPEFDPRTF